MKSERYSIIYSSKTGNTKKLAETIYNTLSKNECDYYGDVNTHIKNIRQKIGNEYITTVRGIGYKI